MRYDHMVKANGIYYEAGKEVPEYDMAEGKEPLPFSDNDLILETKEEKKFTRTDINRMSTAELRKMASNSGVDNADEMTGSELKEYFINVFGL